MAFEQYFTKEWKSIQSTAADMDNISEGFDCNICLDSASDPVVTLCGHLYCWPCIYKWFHFQKTSLASDEPPRCPVCKTAISQMNVVPLYGRGQTASEVEPEGKVPSLGMVIPPRPPACNTQTLINPSNPGHELPYQNQQPFHHPFRHYGEDSSSEFFNLVGGTTTGGVHPVVGMYGEMVYARVFGNSESLYAYPNSYHLEGSRNARLRRQEMQAGKSLNRITIFFFCCFILCLLFF